MIENQNKAYHEDFEWKHSVVERPARAVVKLMNIEDTTIIDDMKKVQEMVKKILNNEEKVISVLDSKENFDDSLEADGQEADDAERVKALVEEESEKETEPKKRIKISPPNRNQADVMSYIQMNLAISSGATSIHWPNYISTEEQIGLTTAAIWDGVTEMIAEGAAVLGNEQGGEEESRFDNNFDVFLM